MERLESGPRGWLFPTLESAYATLRPRSDSRALAAVPLGSLPQAHWVDRLSEYKRRKAAVHARRAAAPIVPGQKNWAPLGPSAVLHGQAVGLPMIGGRVPALAISLNGQIVYAASANGGVFRSDDAGMSWRSLMDAFDTEPTDFASTCLACGAIAIDVSNPDRIYVGTGEGDTNALFQERVVNALPAYRGVGPIRSDDGGQHWVLEPTASGSPSLAGQAFFALAVDPANRENVLGATSEGLYQRVPKAGGAPGEVEWVRRRPGVHSSVVSTTSSGHTIFLAAQWGVGVFQSADGATWSNAGNAFPASNLGRVALGIQPGRMNALYALASTANGGLLGVYRLDALGGAWQAISNPPPVLPSPQGDYDLALAVDPADSNLIYLGGSYFNDPQFYSGSIWRCQITPSGSGYTMAATSIGTRAHADVHVLVHSPNDPNALWCGCDGGVFLNRSPRTSDAFAARNQGLACLCPNFIAQHPTDPHILFCGLQDNGTARSSGQAIWDRVNGGDGGYCVVNWHDPQQVIVFADGTLYRSVSGGQDLTSWTDNQFPWSTMTEPIVSPPYNPSSPQDATIVALGTGGDIFISRDFGASWPSSPTVTVATAGKIFALAFASASRFFCGTTAGEVFRGDQSGSGWTITRLDDAPVGSLAHQGWIADIAIDWSDESLASVYIAFSGVGSYQHVWHFDGSKWASRSGPAGGDCLLDVEHNAIVVDRGAPANVYAGADIGVWHSADSGATWSPLSNGLPEAPVFDLQIHPTQRLLRAATHGRGIYEFAL